MTQTTAAAIHPHPSSPRWEAPAAGNVFDVFRDGDSGAYRYLLLLRFSLVNLIGCALLGAAWLQGWIPIVLRADTTNLVVVIIAAFAAGLVMTGRKVIRISHELNQIKEPQRDRRSRVAGYLRNIEGADAQGRATIAATLRLKLGARISAIRHIANGLVLLGLIGTVLGFIIALSGVDPTAGTVPVAGPPAVTCHASMLPLASTRVMTPWRLFTRARYSSNLPGFT